MNAQERPKLRLISNNGAPVAVVSASERTLERVLEHLQRNDALFDYNVPPEWRDPVRKGLQEYLIRTYRPEQFEITGESAVKKYLRQYDFVEFYSDKPVFGYRYYLKPGMKGAITEVNLSQKYPLTVLWEQCDELQAERTLNHTGDDLALLPKGIFNRKKITSKVELLAAAAPGRIVEPLVVVFKYSWYLPAGATGIAIEIRPNDNLPPVGVIFGNTEGYLPPENGTLLCRYGNLKLFRENNVDIRNLIRELS